LSYGGLSVLRERCSPLVLHAWATRRKEKPNNSARPDIQEGEDANDDEDDALLARF
jgi:hypothetical protein